MIIKATSHTINKIWILLLFIFLLFTALTATLVYGIKIDEIALPKIKVYGLYIKLDKKLILDIQSISIDKDAKRDTSIEEISYLTTYFPYINQFFETISIASIIYDNKTVTLYFKDDIFYLNSDYITLDANVLPKEDGKIHTQIKKLVLKDFHISLEGNLDINLRQKVYQFLGKFETFGIEGIIETQISNDILNYRLATKSFQKFAPSMEFLFSKVELDPIAQDWIYKNIVGREYILDYFEGKFDLNTLDYFPLSMKGHATVKDAIIKFNPDVPSAKAKQIGVTFEKDSLIFDVVEPIYQGKKIDKTNIYIYNLLAPAKPSGIVVNLNAESLLDENIHKILRAFNINVPITQHSGKTDAKVNLDIKFLPFDINATGEFIVKDAKFSLSDLNMYSSNAKIRLDNYNIYLDNTNMQYQKLFDINTTGVFNTLAQTYEGSSSINHLSVKLDALELIEAKNIQNLSSHVAIDKLGNTIIQIDELSTKIFFGQANNVFDFSSLSSISKLSPLLKTYDIQNGDATIYTQDFKNFAADLNLKEVKTPFMEDNKTILDFTIHLDTDTKTFSAKSKNEKLSLKAEKDITLHVKDYNISIKDETTNYFPIKVNILGNNSSFIDSDANRTIPCDSFTATLFKDTTKLSCQKNTSAFLYDKNREGIQIAAESIDSNFLNLFAGVSYFDDGNFSLHVKGKDKKTLSGKLQIHQAIVKDLSFFDNLMATINAVPSLLIFKDPKFNQDGYFIKDGFINFSRSQNIIAITELKLTGNNADIVGKGFIDTDSNKLSLDLKIRTLKTFSSAIDMIPIVGGLILGEDKHIYTNIDVRGTIANPTIETHILKDTVKTPINIIKRTVELPLKIFQ
ncbi:MAG: AsmA-like C-terminal domain-containing protein [Sulfurospirillaceae bacterium]|nr:AsmA-like C-terminal domain-containing protein [Sulfurospirillaceae bacterium]